ncbi:uncharacterized protein LY79DRAFT_578643 [Colletotrichum navitas]|uniref:Uncharacterized protein n=1 Tax=Colletotrichum navitas TaxID=681940 RepID=A0AAD8V7F4_9PEZI|nr:uncharacterized protein LY79DRAFT_578643 [Colletotrichum navitas]KAK1594350.1 hypothetical protein LY79DRAFT_578643 [Colletotrichum navitas]
MFCFSPFLAVCLEDGCTPLTRRGHCRGYHHGEVVLAGLEGPKAKGVKHCYYYVRIQNAWFYAPLGSALRYRPKAASSHDLEVRRRACLVREADNRGWPGDMSRTSPGGYP